MPADRIKNQGYFFAAFVILTMALFSFPASAQITKTARIELDDNTTHLPLGPDVYITQDKDSSLNEQIIAQRHENNLRGDRQDSDVVNLGFAPPPVWMVFSVTNSSASEDWILHFGSLSEGRMGLVRKLIVKNQTRDEVFVRAMREDGHPGAYGETLIGSAVPVKIGVGKTELFVVYLQADGALPSTFVPSLMTPQAHFNSVKFSDIFTNLMLLFFVGAAAFFGAIAFIEKTPLFSLFSAYYIGNMAMFLLIQSMFFISFSFSGDLAALLFPICFLVGIAMTWVFLGITVEDYSDNAIVLSLGSFIVVCALIAIILPGAGSFLDNFLVFVPATAGMGVLAFLSFNHAQRGKLSAYFLGSGWVMPIIGTFITILSAAQIFSSNAFFLNAYWLSLVPQALFFCAGISKNIQMKRDEDRAAISRESRAAQSMARLKQSKETADQARLLRVIERERELMAELREQEMQRTEEMRRAKEMADSANRAKSAFLAVVSHEIRTPMTGIMGLLRVLKDTKMSKEQSDYFLTIQKSSDTMMALLNDILDFEKIESGNMDLEEIDYDLPKLVQGVVTLMSGHAADRKVVLKSDIPDDFPAVLKGDPTRVRQVLLNLVNNAIKFTENGSVTIRLRATRLQNRQNNLKGDYEVYFGVEDTGIGISEKAQERLFTPFEQADSSVSRKYGGTGLGLAICQRLVTAMGGAISVTSQVGVGSVFFFSLLLKKGDGDSAEDMGQAPVAAAKPVTPSMRILVIEDNEINRKVLQNILEKENHVVTLAESGERGLEIFTKQPFDAVFTDINLTGMNGMEVARTIRTLPDRKAAITPIIALTGNVAEEDVQSFYKAGINGFVGKPIDYDQLLAMLADIHRHSPPELKAEVKAAEAKAAPASPKTESKPEIRRERSGTEQRIQAQGPHGGRQNDQKPQERKQDQDVSPLHKYLQEQENEIAANLAKSAETKPAEPAAPAAGHDFGTVFDMKMLDGLLRSLGKDQMKELLDGFILKTDEIVAALQDAAQADDKNTIYERAHELKGMAANFGMKDLAKIAGVAEKAAKNGQISAEEIAQMPNAAEKTKAAIRVWLS